MTHALYRFYGDAGILLYVGITDNPQRRFGQHAKGKDWWPQVRGISIDWYETRQAVEAAERRAVSVEQPLHNKVLRRRLVALPGPPRSLGDMSRPEIELVMAVECAWTSFWWNDPSAVRPTQGFASRSKYRHDGRRYAPQPDDWPAVVAEMHRQGVTEDQALEAIRVIKEANRFDPERMAADVMWPVFTELVKPAAVPV